VLLHAHLSGTCPRVPLPLTLQLLSSSADRMMEPHFFPGTPLERRGKMGSQTETQS
jgi:hypothetical protein